MNLNCTFPNITYIDVPADGSCLLHCICKASYLPYQLSMVNKDKFVRDLRDELSAALNGKAAAKMKSCVVLDTSYMELINNKLDKDIYIVSNGKLLISSSHRKDQLYRDRISIVISYSNNHYRLIGLSEGSTINTTFSLNHKFIRCVRNLEIENG